jgi:epoxide hydrolase-like predicted phosphatase
MEQSIKAIIFDVGGVLVRTVDPAPRRRLAAEMRLSVRDLYAIVFESDTWNQAQTGRIPPERHWQAVGQRLSLTKGQGHDFRRAFFSGDRLDRALLDLIRELRPRYKIGILSNNVGDLRRWIADEWGVPDGTFDAVVISAEEGVMKPDPAIYRTALTRLGVGPQEAVFVDDFVENVQAAQALGLRAVHHVSRERTEAQIRALLETDPPDVRVDVPAPDDYAAMLRVSRAVAQEDWWGAVLLLAQPQNVTDVALLCDDPENLLLVARVGGQVAGAGLLLQPAPPVLHHTAELSVAVHPSHRRRGVARKLIGTLLSDGARRGVELVRAWVAAANGAALALMAGLGFREMARLKEELQHPDGRRFDVIVHNKEVASAGYTEASGSQD